MYVCMSWTLLGSVGMPYGRTWASWMHFGHLRRASWSVFGASRWHPEARRGPHLDLRERRKSCKKKSTIALIWWSISRCDIDAKMGTECQFGMHEVHVAVKPSARKHKWNVSPTRRLNFLTIAEDRSIAMRGIDLISECGDLLNQYSPKLYTQT